MTDKNKLLLNLYRIEEIKPALIGYFCYYASKYKPEQFKTTLFFELDFLKDGSRSLDNYFIDILSANGWTIEEDFLLHKFYFFKEV